MMKIRKAASTDLIQLSELFDQYRVFYRKTSDIKGANTFLKKRLSEQDSRLYLCENDQSKIIGFVQLYPLFSSTKMKKLWLLNDLFVHADFRGKGISKLLIERAKQLVIDSKACGMFLETEKTNNIGNKLYPKTGFTLNEESKFYEWFVH